jgi:hypothetical protein
MKLFHRDLNQGIFFIIVKTKIFTQNNRKKMLITLIQLYKSDSMYANSYILFFLNVKFF